MARPREFDADEVLNQALDIFWQHGYRATTTRDLEAELGLTQSSLYNAFGSKSDLLNIVLDRYEDRICERLVQPLEAGESLDAIADFFSGLSEWISSDGKHGCLVVNMMAEDGGATDRIVRRTRRFRERVRNALRSVLQQAGALEDGELELRADLLMGLALGLNIAARGGAEPIELQRLLAGALHQIEVWRD